MENPKILVIDVPASMPPDEATNILSEPYTRGYYLRSISPGETMRALFTQYARPDDGQKCEEELQAMALVVEHRKRTTTRIVQILCEHDILRSANWVNKVREEL